MKNHFNSGREPTSMISVMTLKEKIQVMVEGTVLSNRVLCNSDKTRTRGDQEALRANSLISLWRFKTNEYSVKDIQ